MHFQPKNVRRVFQTLPAWAIVLGFLLVSSTNAQDFSQLIKKSANACMDATTTGDYKTLLEYTYPPLVTLLDSIAGGAGQGKAMIEQQIKSLKEQGVTIDSGIVGEPTAHVKAGKELIAIVPTVMYMTVKEKRIKQESYMIAVSANAGKNWTFVNSSPEDKKMMALLFPNWNPALKLPEKKGPEVLSMGDEE